MNKFWFKRMGQDARRGDSDGGSAFGDGENSAPDVDPVEAFELWMRNRKDPRGNRKFTDAKIRKRVDAFQGCQKIFRDAKILDAPLELVDDPAVLEKVESAFLSCPEYKRQTEKYRNRLSAAFHVYVAYRKDTQEDAASEGRILPLDGDFHEFANAVPVRYKIGADDERRVESWADLLVQIVESELARNKPRLEAFNFASPIPSLHPLFMEKELSNVECRQLSTGCWINVDWSTPLMIQSIKAVCRSCGYDDKNIRIWIKDQNDEPAEDDLEQDVTPELDDSSDDETTDTDWTSGDLSDFEQPDDVTPNELALEETSVDESDDEEEFEWTEESDDETQSEGEFAWADDDEFVEDSDDDESVEELEDESAEELVASESQSDDLGTEGQVELWGTRLNLRPRSSDVHTEKTRFEEEVARVDKVGSAEEPSVEKPRASVGNDAFEIEQDEEDVVRSHFNKQGRFDNACDFAETVPAECYIGGRLVTSFKNGESVIPGEWKIVLLSVVNYEIGQKKPEIELLEKQSLQSTRKSAPFFIGWDTASNLYRRVNNGRKIFLDYDTPQMLEVIADFCRFVGYKDSEIILRGRKKTSDDQRRYDTTGRSTNVNYPKPGKCRVGLEIYEKETWADLLYCIVEHEVKYPNKLSNNSIWSLYDAPLQSTQPCKSFFLEEEQQGRFCRYLPCINRWIDLDYDDGRLIRIIRDFCKVAGYGPNAISIGYKEKSAGQLVRESVNMTATAPPTPPKALARNFDEVVRKQATANVPQPSIEVVRHTTNADASRPACAFVPRPPKVGLIYCDFENYDDFEGTVPCDCSIGEYKVPAEIKTWADLLFDVVKRVKRTFGFPRIKELFSRPLLPSLGDKPFYLKEGTGEPNCRRLTVNDRSYWINLNYDCPRLVESVVEFCSRTDCLRVREEIVLCGRKKNVGVLSGARNSVLEPVKKDQESSPPQVDVVEDTPRRTYSSSVEPALAKFSDVVSLMRERWQNGLNIRSLRDIEVFRDDAEENGVVVPSGNVQLVRELLRVGVVVGDRVYCKSETFPQEIRDITEKAFSFGNDVVYYESLYEKNEEWAHENSIWSVDLLAAFLEKYARGFVFRSRFMTRGGAKSEKEAVIGEVLHVWGEERAINVEELNRRLPMIPRERIKEFVTDDSRFLSASKTEGRFFLLSRFKPSESTKRNILDFVETRCQEDGYATLADLPLGDLDYEYHELPRFALFNALEKTVLSPKFVVEKKIITRSGESFDLIKLLKREFGKQDSVLLDDALTRIDELAEYLGGQREIAFNTLYETMVRVEKDRFVADRFVSFEVDEIDQLLSEFIQDGFCAVRDIIAFHRLPYCGQTWNSFLLESYCFRFSRKYRLFVRHFNDKNAGVVAERGRFKEGESYENILAVALARSDVELTPEKAGEYLFKNGYAAKSQYKGLDEIVKKAAKLREQG